MGKKKSSTTGPSKYAKPHINAALSATNQAVAGNAGNLEDISGQLRDVLGTATTQYQDQSGLNAADSYNQDVLGGNYLNSNPYLDQIVGKTGDSVSDRVNSIFSKAGRTGGYAHGEGVAEGVANAENQLRYSDYDTQMGRMDDAASRAAQLEAARYSGLGAINSTAANAAQIPYLGANTLAQNTQGLLGNATTTTQSQGLGNTLGGLVGTGLTGWATGGFG